MKALIFAAGIGSRLKPWTDQHPKALAPVGGVPMLERVILKLKALGIAEMVVNVHHFASQIIEFLVANNNFGVKIDISDESNLLLDTGGGMLHARQYLQDSPFLVHNADIFTNVDLVPMMAASTGPLATLLVAERTTSRYLLFNQQMLMHGWENVKTGEVIGSGSPFAFNGIHICNPEIFPLLESYAASHGPVFSITPFYVETCQSHEILGYKSPTPYDWIDIGKPESLALANSKA
ncbi:MAG: NTP transferase domain-containing protein [Bacteroidales bacterium]|nr:NTP transferase domain-containing protein [Bacteroidales bacterium]